MSRRQLQRPRVIANFAMTVDGKISTRAATPAMFTSQHDKRRLLEIRALGDAVMVGRNTVAADNMSMGLSDAGLRADRKQRGAPAHPLRVIVSGSGRLPAKLKVFRAEGGPIRVFTSPTIPAATQRRIQSIPGARVHVLDPLDVRTMLAILRREDSVQTLVCEGGPGLFRSLVEADCLDELRITIAPCVFGGKNAPTLTGLPGDFLPQSKNLRLAEIEVIQQECYLRYIAEKPSS